MDKNAIGYIVEIPNEYTVIINVGEFSVSVGDKIYIYESGKIIEDPITNQKLGQYDFIKETVEVTEVYQEFSVCKKVVRKKGNKISIAMTPLLQENIYVTYDELKVNPDENKHWAISNSLISIGDPVKNKIS
ncbi:Hypothetical protein Tpal_460 [Trichococcus palustris]|uniref:Uncharacterized protein n=1 Tax=Trichococcus palustris TaxID=140314 RepID=A0A143Y9X8_9LACT|nr:hypothetical protein [Trichococcus palustris]CZQ83556.1 Hypothetical protein Tpal_460 [Trichococcus palustris]SFK70089.1 hypothetical protein SAMN04488076_103170 [Trichococcus palustris]